MTDQFLLFFLVCLIFLIAFIKLYPRTEINNEIVYETKSLSNLAETFSVNHSRIYNDDYVDDGMYFKACSTGNEKDCQWPLGMNVYDKRTGDLLLPVDETANKKRIYPNSHTIPKRCGFGRLLFDKDTLKWECQCSAPSFFGGDFCDIPGEELTGKYNCRQVAHIDNIENYDVSSFNPITEGICVECTKDSMIPVIDAGVPSCQTEEKEEDIEIKDPCFFDALNPKRGSPMNKHVENYGCSCDYENGYIEISGIESNRLVSKACVKLGRNEDFHRADIAFYCVKNQNKPIQIHSYTKLEFPFTNIFDKYREVLVVQDAHDVVHERDWLNRNVRAKRGQKIRRLNYPRDTWPVVDKYHLVNKYRRRAETINLSTWDLNIGRGFETKHWYETTNNRWLSNAIWGTPIVYGTHATDKIWNKKSTLNPLGVKHKWYYGITMKTKTGEIVRLDTRGYDQEKKSVNTLTNPPHHANDMMNPEKIIYLPYLYTHYRVKR